MQHFLKRAFALLFTFILFVADAQPLTVEGFKANVSVASPEAATLFKFADIPVSEYTGVPNINIPITSFQNGTINVNVSLSYHAAGHKVSEHANWIGLGWKINAGGMISRKVRGLPDDSNRGIGFLEFRKTNTISSIVAKYTTARSAFAGVITTLSESCADSEPDEFYFDVDGYSGKFAFDWTDNQSTSTVFVPVVSSSSPVKIKGFTDPNAGNSKTLVKWELTAPDGTIYTFAAPETTQNQGSKICNLSSVLTYTSSWYLTRITNTNVASQYVEFQYDTYGFQTDWLASESNVAADPTGCGAPYTLSGTSHSSSSNTVINGQRIKAIIGYPTNIRIDFNANTLRTDIVNGAGNTNNKQLDEVVISGVNDVPKKFNFVYIYQGDRLTLKRVFESGGTLTTPPHEFTYNATTLPSRLSKGVDHWGYANGKTDNQSFIPATDVVTGNNNVATRGSGDRSPSADDMKAQILEKIIYPTGGISELVYEPHDYGYVQSTSVFSNGEYVRIERESSVSAVSSQAGTTSKEIVLSEPYTIVNLTVDCSNNSCIPGGDGSVFCPNAANLPRANLYSKSGTTWVLVRTYNPRVSGQELSRVVLQPGTYKIEATTGFWTNGGLANGITLTFRYKENDLTRPIRQKMAGGLRVKEVKTYKDVNDNAPISRTYVYKINQNGQDISSGVLNGEPIYEMAGETYFPRNCLQPVNCLTSTMIGSSTVLFGETNGSHIGYRKVTVSYANGKMIKEFTSPYEYPDLISIQKPFAHPTSNNHKTGLLKTETTLDVAGVTVQTKTLNYSFKDIDIASLKVGESISCSSSDCWPADVCQCDCLLTNDRYALGGSPLRMGFAQLLSTTSTVDNITTTSSYTYDSNLQLKKTESTTNSDGRTVVATFDYATDLNNQTLINKFMVGIPLKFTQTLGNKTKTSLIEYDVFNSNQVLPRYIKELSNDGSTWLTKLNIAAYNTDGLPTTVYTNNSILPENYVWAANLQLLSKNVGYLKQTYAYKTSARLLDYVIDENGFKTTFKYDDLMRLNEVKNYFEDGSPRSTTLNTYNYRPATVPVANKNDKAFNNYINTKTTFVGIAAPLSTTQFFDGLGRGIEVVKEFYTPKVEPHPTEVWHQKNYVTYDALGRQNFGYQPFESNTLDVEAAPNGTPYVYPEYELSPLSRITKQYAEDGKFMTTDYGSNASVEVRKFTVSNENGVSANGYYDANLLYKTTITNENGKRTVVFKDKLGRNVLTRKFLGTTEVDTYNVYDDFGNLIMVIPPGAIVTNTIQTDLVFTYKYNNQNLLSEKKVSGAEFQKIYYNNRYLPTFIQDGNMRATHPNRYLATEYDQYGRVWHTTWVQTSNNPEADALLADFSPIRTDWMNDYYYDENPTTHAMYSRPPQVRTRPIATTGTLKTGDKLIMWRSTQYNARGEKEWGCPEYLRANNCDDYAWNTDGTLRSGNKYNNWKDNNQNNFNQVFYGHKYEYDHARRLTSAQQALWGPNGSGGGFYAPWVELSGMSYNYKDQLTEKNIGKRMDIWGAKALQSIDYNYNQRGWLTGINQLPVSFHNATIGTRNGQAVLNINPNPTFNVVSGEGSVDLFAESIRYDNPDMNLAAGTPQYNGNISQAIWQVAGRERQAYTYTYDDLDRMTQGVYTDIHDDYSEIAGALGITAASPFEKDNKFNEKLTYDIRGNITSLQRNGMLSLTTNTMGYLAGTFGQIDNLQYSYNAQNQVTAITDAANTTKGFKYGGFTSDAYRYDKNGNLSKDRNKGIDTIIYNYLNLPQTIQFTNNRKIEFVYDGTGMKLRKTTWENGIIKETRDYMDGFEYKDDKIELIHHQEGVITRREKRTNEGTEFVGLGGLVWQYEYMLKDHLGNTRVTFADTTGNGLIDPNTEISQINHYYPFGLNMEGNWNGTAGKNKYQYNDKEWNDDFGLGLNDYGARMYDPAIARWNSVDPLSEQYLRWSPYNYTKGNPIKNIDPDGMSVASAINDVYAKHEERMAEQSVRWEQEAKKSDAERSAEKFKGKMNDARKSAQDDKGGYEFGFLIFIKPDGTLYASTTIKSDNPGVIMDEWSKAMKDCKPNDAVAGVYHTHPLEANTGGDNPFSAGDMNQFLIDVGSGIRGGVAIGKQYFSIVDSRDDNRYVVSIKPEPGSYTLAQNFANKNVVTVIEGKVYNQTYAQGSWRDTASNFWVFQYQDSLGSMSNKHMAAYNKLSNQLNSGISVTNTALSPLKKRK